MTTRAVELPRRPHVYRLVLPRQIPWRVFRVRLSLYHTPFYHGHSDVYGWRHVARLYPLCPPPHTTGFSRLVRAALTPIFGCEHLCCILLDIWVGDIRHSDPLLDAGCVGLRSICMTSPRQASFTAVLAPCAGQVTVASPDAAAPQFQWTFPVMPVGTTF